MVQGGLINVMMYTVPTAQSHTVSKFNNPTNSTGQFTVIAIIQAGELYFVNNRLTEFNKISIFSYFEVQTLGYRANLHWIRRAN